MSDVTPEMMEAFRLAFRKIGVDLYGISSYEFRDAIFVALSDTVTIPRADFEALMAAAKALKRYHHPPSRIDAPDCPCCNCEGERAMAGLRAAGIEDQP